MAETMQELLGKLRVTHKELTTVSMNYIQRALDILKDDEMFYFRKAIDYEGILSDIRVKSEVRFINGILKNGTVILRPQPGDLSVYDGIALTKLSIGHLVGLIEVLEKGNFHTIKWNFPINKHN